ncbi:MAG: hypothetical protein LBP50_07830 [Tannerella sp.]|nr:hypothetical protein [Tannerella sp.]
MSKKNYLPKNIVKLIDWAVRFFAYLNAHYTQWKVDSILVQETETKFTDMRTAYETYSKPETHSPMYHDAMMKKKKIFVEAVQQLAQYLSHNPYLEPEDFDGLDINPPSRGPYPRHPRPHTSPKMRFAVGEEHGWVYLHFWDEMSEGSKAKPFGTQGAEIRYLVCKPGEEPKSVEDLTGSEFATRTPYLFEFSDRQAGLILCVAMRWENTRGEKGPWSHIETVVIP